MKFLDGEILFKNREEALKNVDVLLDNEIVLYVCAKCGISFASSDPFTSEGGIICTVCRKAMNMYYDENYHPEDDFSEIIDGSIPHDNLFD